MKEEYLLLNLLHFRCSPPVRSWQGTTQGWGHHLSELSNYFLLGKFSFQLPAYPKPSVDLCFNCWLSEYVLPMMTSFDSLVFKSWLQILGLRNLKGWFDLRWKSSHLYVCQRKQSNIALSKSQTKQCRNDNMLSINNIHKENTSTISIQIPHVVV